MIEKILTLIAPHSCLQCAAEGALLCQNCAIKLPPAPSLCYRCQRETPNFQTCHSCKSSPLCAVHPVTMYTKMARDLVWRFKFERARAASHDIASLLTLPEENGVQRIVVHVPTATSRIRQRGYDQARLLAREVAKRYHVPSIVALARIGQQRQVGMSGAARRHQLQTAFRVTLPSVVAGKHIILIDDVVTSGATLEAAAAALRHAGAERVEAVVFARA